MGSNCKFTIDLDCFIFSGNSSMDFMEYNIVVVVVVVVVSGYSNTNLEKGRATTLPLSPQQSSNYVSNHSWLNTFHLYSIL